ncbi:hypothetical protein AB6A40_009154 [Gnathostoma spinigerum]|uniref:C2 domain-containing protein n=1 Tax=Gnathostoma spinigerum TaxID=75299 RepID=A0ABD6ER53_9BILA
MARTIPAVRGTPTRTTGHANRLRSVESQSSTSASSEDSLRTRSDAVFSESFLFHIPSSMLDTCHIVIEMFDRSRENSDAQPISVGYCVLGPNGDASGSAHWYSMIQKGGLPVCMWHRLRQD